LRSLRYIVGDLLGCQGPLAVPRLLAYISFSASPFLWVKPMTKRKKTELVQVKLRVREGLRRRLEAVARSGHRPLAHEMVLRLENSFEQEKNSHVLQALLAPGVGLELIRAVASIINNAGRDWNTPPKSHAIAEAITKIVAVLSHELRPDENSFPNRNQNGSADQLAWPAVLVGRWQSFSDEYWRRGGAAGLLPNPSEKTP
jgi:hypothetical protein